MKSSHGAFRGSNNILAGLNREYINVAMKSEASAVMSSKGYLSRTAPSYPSSDTENRGRPNPLPPTQPNPGHTNHSFRESILVQDNQSMNDVDSNDFDDRDLDRSSAFESLNRLRNQRIGKPPLKLVSGSQFRNLSGKEFHKCENCEELERLNKKSKESIRSLKLQLNRLEDSYSGLKKTKNLDIVGTNFSATAVESSELHDLMQAKELLQRRCDDQEVELSKLKKLLQKEKSLHETLLEKHNANLESLNQFKISSAAESKAFSDEINDLKSQIQKLNVALLKSQDNNDKMDQKLKECNKQLALRKDMPDLSGEVDRLKKENGSLTINNGNLQNEIDKLNVLNSELAKSFSTLEASKNINDEALRAKSKELSDILFELDKQKSDNASLDLERKKTVDDKLSLELLFREKNDEINALNKDKKALTSEVDRLNNKVSELMRKILAESEAIKKALELAISGSMRLCVVAPTVNVHVSDRKLKFKGALSDKALKEFLSNEVLGKYSFLFRQMEEDVSPDGSSLQDWIQKMLGDMQASIEQHINSAMEDSR